ncbi:MAK10-like protein [Tanacetum coccineum]
MSNTNTNLQIQTSSVLHNDTISLCSTSKVQEKTQLSKSRCMNSLQAIQSQFKFLTETLQDFGTMSIFKRTFSQDLDLLEQHLTKETISQTDCKTILTKLRTTFENAFNSEFKARMGAFVSVGCTSEGCVGFVTTRKEGVFGVGFRLWDSRGPAEGRGKGTKIELTLEQSQQGVSNDVLLRIGLLEETKNVLGLAERTKSYPVGIVRNVEVYVGKLKLLENFYVIDMEKDPCPLLVGRGFLATTSSVIDCAQPPYYFKKDFKDNHVPEEWEIARDAELNPFKDEYMINKKIDWKKPPKEGDGAWHIKIELINPDGEKFDRVFQSIPTTRKLFEKEKPCDVIDLEHFYDA